jgi:urea transport system ATP-binding protein
MSMLQVEKLNQYYGAAHTLRGVSLTVEKGQCVALLGRNGVGKTTLLKCLMGVLPAASGKVVFNGQDITRLKPHERARLGIAYVPQGREIFARLTVEENLLMGMATKPARRAGGIKLRSVRAVPGVQGHAGPARRRSVRRPAAAARHCRALLADPKLIILDEPTEGIQPSIIKDIERVIRLLRERGDMGILLCEQYFDFAHALADKFVVLSRGEVVASGVQEVMQGEDVKRHLAV